MLLWRRLKLGLQGNITAPTATVTLAPSAPTQNPLLDLPRPRRNNRRPQWLTTTRLIVSLYLHLHLHQGQDNSPKGQNNNPKMNLSRRQRGVCLLKTMKMRTRRRQIARTRMVLPDRTVAGG